MFYGMRLNHSTFKGIKKCKGIKKQLVGDDDKILKIFHEDRIITTRSNYTISRSHTLPWENLQTKAIYRM